MTVAAADQPRRSLVALWVAIALVAVLATVALGVALTRGGTSTMRPSVAGPASSVTVPQVLRLTKADAVTRLQTAGLKVGAVRVVYSQLVPDGTVLSITPAVGSTVPKGGDVTLTLSKRPRPTH